MKIKSENIYCRSVTFVWKFGLVGHPGFSEKYLVSQLQYRVFTILNNFAEMEEIDHSFRKLGAESTRR